MYQIFISNYFANYIRDRGTSVCIETKQQVMGWAIGVQFPAGAGNFSLRHRVQTGSGAHPASYPMGIGGLFLGSKAARA
jgi:hypothetical protein